MTPIFLFPPGSDYTPTSLDDASIIERQLHTTRTFPLFPLFVVTKKGHTPEHSIIKSLIAIREGFCLFHLVFFWRGVRLGLTSGHLAGKRVPHQFTIGSISGFLFPFLRKASAYGRPVEAADTGKEDRGRLRFVFGLGLIILDTGMALDSRHSLCVFRRSLLGT